MAGYGRLSYLEREQEYPRSQEIAEACAFLGADGLRVPNARDSTQGNLIVFCEQPTVVDKRVVKNHGSVDLPAGWNSGTWCMPYPRSADPRRRRRIRQYFLVTAAHGPSCRLDLAAFLVLLLAK